MSSMLYLGCPVWACEHWKGTLYSKSAARSQWLGQYSSAFNTVEGNSTFYALPSLETAAKWADAVKPGFRFALKVPRVISHDCRLQGCQRELQAFVDVAEVLNSRGCLGPSFLQLPPDYSPRNREELQRFLELLPGNLPWAVEVRHAGWFDDGPHEQWLDTTLSNLGMDKVLFDSRPLYSLPPSDEIERTSQSRKPKTPVRQTTTGQHPFLRLIGRNRLNEVQPWIDEWAPIIARWLEQGLQPFVFTHAPDDQFAPPFARILYNAIALHRSQLPPAPIWPGELERPPEVQLRLF